MSIFATIFGEKVIDGRMKKMINSVIDTEVSTDDDAYIIKSVQRFVKEVLGSKSRLVVEGYTFSKYYNQELDGNRYIIIRNSDGERYTFTVRELIAA